MWVSVSEPHLWWALPQPEFLDFSKASLTSLNSEHLFLLPYFLCKTSYPPYLLYAYDVKTVISNVRLTIFSLYLVSNGRGFEFPHRVVLRIKQDNNRSVHGPLVNCEKRHHHHLYQNMEQCKYFRLDILVTWIMMKFSKFIVLLIKVKHHKCQLRAGKMLMLYFELNNSKI